MSGSRQILSIVLWVVAWMSGWPCSAAPLSNSEFSGYDIIVLAGQSNAEGVGMGPVFADRTNDARLFQFGRAGADNYKIIPAADPLQSWSYPNNAVSFGMSFAREYAVTMPADRHVLIIPVAYGGSSILQWLSPPSEHSLPSPSSRKDLYADMRMRILTALGMNPANRVVALLWHQGETDIIYIQGQTPLMAHKNVYAMHLQNFITNLRADFPTVPAFPILMGEPVASWMARDSVRTGLVSRLKDVARKNHETYFVGSYGLKSNAEAGYNPADTIHFSGQAQTTYGKRYFKAYKHRLSIETEQGEPEN